MISTHDFSVTRHVYRYAATGAHFFYTLSKYDLEVGVNQSQSTVKAHANQTGNNAHIALEANSREEADLSFIHIFLMALSISMLTVINL